MLGLSKLLSGSKRVDGVTCIAERHRTGNASAPPNATSSDGATSCQRRPAAWRDPDDHAVALLDMLQAEGLQGDILATDMREHHQRMCEAKGWTPRKWQSVAREVARRTTGGRKVYAWVGKHRLRVYPLYWAPVRDCPTGSTATQ